jgi:hypothetical protein
VTVGQMDPISGTATVSLTGCNLPIIHGRHCALVAGAPAESGRSKRYDMLAISAV